MSQFCDRLEFVKIELSNINEMLGKVKPVEGILEDNSDNT